MQRTEYNVVPTTFINEDREEGKYTTLYTDIGNFEILKPKAEVQADIARCKLNNVPFLYRKLDEYSKVMEKYWELELDLVNIKILWYMEHHIIDDLKKARELEKLAPKK